MPGILRPSQYPAMMTPTVQTNPPSTWAMVKRSRRDRQHAGHRIHHGPDDRE